MIQSDSIAAQKHDLFDCIHITDKTTNVNVLKCT